MSEVPARYSALGRRLDDRREYDRKTTAYFKALFGGTGRRKVERPAYQRAGLFYREGIILFIFLAIACGVIYFKFIRGGSL